MIQKIKCWLGWHEYSLQWYYNPSLKGHIINIKCPSCRKKLKVFEIRDEYFYAKENDVNSGSVF